MSNPRWLPILAFALAFTVGAAVLGFWSLGWLRSPRDDTSGRASAGECAPMGSAGKPISPECPQAAPPTARTP